MAISLAGGWIAGAASAVEGGPDAAAPTGSSTGTSTGAATDTATKPLRVFVLAGQSNMQGHAHARTMDAMALDPATSAWLDRMRQADGTPRVRDDVWISSIGSADTVQSGPLTVGFGASRGGPKIGPELSFGIAVGDHFDEPVLLIKTAWGGKSLHTDFRPPSAARDGGAGADGAGADGARGTDGADDAGSEIDPDAPEAPKGAGDIPRDAGPSYRLMVDHIRSVLDDIPNVVPGYDPDVGYELSGFVWFQGWNDMVDRNAYPDRASPGGYDRYRDLLAALIRDVRRDLDCPELPFVIGVMGVGGPIEQYPASQRRYAPVHRNFRHAMAAPADMPEFAGRVVAVLTETCWDMEVSALQERAGGIQERVDTIRQAMKDGTMERSEGEAALDQLDRETFSERERVLLRTSTSNAAFHYLGSARIMSRIGAAFADAMLTVTDEDHVPTPTERIRP
ncbi:MAG: sialate O-acetylesterase [Phycisphaerales bacterium]